MKRISSIRRVKEQKARIAARISRTRDGGAAFGMVTVPSLNQHVEGQKLSSSKRLGLHWTWIRRPVNRAIRDANNRKCNPCIPFGNVRTEHSMEI